LRDQPPTAAASRAASFVRDAADRVMAIFPPGGGRRGEQQGEQDQDALFSIVPGAHSSP
jgi:hypothetical protein